MKIIVPISILLHFSLNLSRGSPFLSQNNALRYLFKKMTRDSNWPRVEITDLKKVDECRYFNPSVKFPEYYLKDFHAYDGGNLNPVAAKEATSATRAVMTHHFRNLSGEETSHYVRRAFNLMTSARTISQTLPKVDDHRVVDFGCGIGVSTAYLKDAFRDSHVTGIDLSPYFLDETPVDDTTFIHGDIESTGIENDSVDVVSISYVLHELPYETSKMVLREAFRVLKPGTGVLSILDMHNPVSSSRMMKYIFERTEPYLEEYSKLLENMEPFLETTGYGNIDKFVGFPKTVIYMANKNI